MALPLPPPERDVERAPAGSPGREVDDSARVRMSEYVPDTTARDLPQLPQAWNEDTDNGPTAIDSQEIPLDRLATGRTAMAMEPPRPPRAERVSDGESPRRATIPNRAGADRPRKLPLPSTPVEAQPVVAPRPLPVPPPPVTPPPRPIAPPPRAQAPSPPRSQPVAPPAPAPHHKAASGGAPRPTPMPRVEEGVRLVAGRYQMLERIGQGGMGKVFKVVHSQLGKTFALKVIGEQLAQTDEARNLFYREARLASSLSHPNITSVVDFGEDDELGMFMVMELVDGEPLARMLHREGRLSVRLACEIILQVAEALHYIHDSEIVHCDIKTENILLCESQSTKRRQLLVKLLDFGLARSLASGRNTASLSGTPHYVAPERIRGEPPSPSSDIYGLGILLYELVTGKVPWDGHVAQILAGHLEQPPTPPSQLVGGLDPAFENLILRSLAKTPRERHKDMAAFIYELRTVMDMLGFGRRTGRRGARRVIIERTKNERAELLRTVFEGCRLPLSLIAPNGLILVANPAFAKFVMGVAVDVEGLTVQSTPLAGCWGTFEADLARAVAGTPIRRVLEMDTGPGETRKLLMWLDAAPAGHALLGVQPLDL